MDKDTALDLALEALEAVLSDDQPYIDKSQAAITAIKQALAAPVQEPVRIYDYVWPQRDEHKEACVYACSYTPGHHLARGELLAVVHPSQLISTYLQRDNEAAHGIASPEAQRQWVGLDAEDRWEIIYATERDERTTVMELVEAKLKEKNT